MTRYADHLRQMLDPADGSAPSDRVAGLSSTQVFVLREVVDLFDVGLALGRAPQCRLSVRRLARRTRLASSTVRAALEALVAAGLVDRIARATQHAPNVYAPGIHLGQSADAQHPENVTVPTIGTLDDARMPTDNLRVPGVDVRVPTVDSTVPALGTKQQSRTEHQRSAALAAAAGTAAAPGGVVALELCDAIVQRFPDLSREEAARAAGRIAATTTVRNARAYTAHLSRERVDREAGVQRDRTSSAALVTLPGSPGLRGNDVVGEVVHDPRYGVRPRLTVEDEVCLCTLQIEPTVDLDELERESRNSGGGVSHALEFLTAQECMLSGRGHQPASVRVKGASGSWTVGLFVDDGGSAVIRDLASEEGRPWLVIVTPSREQSGLWPLRAEEFCVRNKSGGYSVDCDRLPDELWQYVWECIRGHLTPDPAGRAGA
jgi:hypothetical protein